MSDEELLLKALSNQKRADIFQFIRNQAFLIKNDLLVHFKMHRAGLDHHLDLLTKAGLIGIHEMNIKGKKYVFVFAKAKIQITVTPVESSEIKEVLPSELTVEKFIKIEINDIAVVGATRNFPLAVREENSRPDLWLCGVDFRVSIGFGLKSQHSGF